MTTTITADMVRDKLRAIRLDHPERINPDADEDEETCRYTYDDGTHCLVGELLTRLDVWVPDVDDAMQNTSTIADLNEMAKDEGFWVLDEEAVALLGPAQSYADMGGSWGEVIEGMPGVVEG